MSVNFTNPKVSTAQSTVYRELDPLLSGQMHKSFPADHEFEAIYERGDII